MHYSRVSDPDGYKHSKQLLIVMIFTSVLHKPAGSGWKHFGIAALLLLPGCATSTGMQLKELPEQAQRSSAPAVATPALAAAIAVKVKVTQPATDPLLADILPDDISSAKKQAMRNFGRSWNTIASRSRFVRHRLLACLHRHAAPDSLQVVPVAEAAYNPYAYSHAGAIGMWQLMPPTAQLLGVHSNRHLNGSRAIDTSTSAAIDYLQQMHDRFHNWPLAFAAYNLGPYALQKRLNKQPWIPADGLDHMPVPRETRIYVQHLIGLTALLQEGTLRFPKPVETRPIQVKAPVDLHRLARLSGMPEYDIFRYNPGLNQSQYLSRDMTIHVPASHIDDIRNHLAQAAPQFIMIRVKQGDSLWSIAHARQIRISTLKQLNRHLGKYLHIGQHIKVPADRQMAEASAHINPLLISKKRIRYRVRSGDSLWRIANRFGTTPASIARANNMRNNHLIRAGDRLWVYAQKVSPS